jgi:hypothetical protein
LLLSACLPAEPGPEAKLRIAKEETVRIGAHQTKFPSQFLVPTNDFEDRIDHALRMVIVDGPFQLGENGLNCFLFRLVGRGKSVLLVKVPSKKHIRLSETVARQKFNSGDPPCLGEDLPYLGKSGSGHCDSHLITRNLLQV